MSRKSDPESAWIPEDRSDASKVDWSKSERMIFANLKPATTTISLRLPAGLLARIKAEANKRDVPYQSYMKTLLAEALDR